MHVLLCMHGCCGSLHCLYAKVFFFCHSTDGTKAEDNAAASGAEAAGVSTFKPGERNGTTEATLEGEGGEKSANAEKKEDEGKKAEGEGVLPPTRDTYQLMCIGQCVLVAAACGVG